MRVDQNDQNPDETTTPPQQDLSTPIFCVAIAMCITLVVIGLIFKWDLMWGIGLIGSIPWCAIYSIDHCKNSPGSNV